MRQPSSARVDSSAPIAFSTDSFCPAALRSSNERRAVLLTPGQSKGGLVAAASTCPRPPSLSRQQPMSEFLPQLPFAAFASYPAALSAPNHPYLPPAPSNAPRHSSTEHNTVLQSHPDPRTQPLPLDTRGNQQSGAGRGGGGTASSSSSKGTIRSGLDTDESPPSSPGSIGEGKRPKEEEVVVSLPVAPPAKVPAKRGRKKKPLPEELEGALKLLSARGGAQRF